MGCMTGLRAAGELRQSFQCGTEVMVGRGEHPHARFAAAADDRRTEVERRPDEMLEDQVEQFAQGLGGGESVQYGTELLTRRGLTNFVDQQSLLQQRTAPGDLDGLDTSVRVGEPARDRRPGARLFVRCRRVAHHVEERAGDPLEIVAVDVVDDVRPLQVCDRAAEHGGKRLVGVADSPGPVGDHDCRGLVVEDGQCEVGALDRVSGPVARADVRRRVWHRSRCCHDWPVRINRSDRRIRVGGFASRAARGGRAFTAIRSKSKGVPVHEPSWCPSRRS
jgi:hypothetical protein